MASANGDLLDISKSSIDMARQFLNSDRVRYIQQDIFTFNPETKYDFITLGEVLEHVENPVNLLLAVAKLLSKDGKLFVTVPANAPSIDHIYLFNNADEIRDVIHAANFRIIDETTAYAEDVSKEKAEKFKVAMMYGAFLETT